MGILAVSAALNLRFVANFKASLRDETAALVPKLRFVTSVLIAETSTLSPFLMMIILLVVYFVDNLLNV